MPRALESSIPLLDGAVNASLLVQFFVDRVWVVVACDGSAGTVMYSTPDADRMGVTPQPSMALSSKGAAHQQGANDEAQCASGEGKDDDDEEAEYLASLRPHSSLVSGSSQPSEVEPLVGLRDDPLTNIVAQRISDAFADAGCRLPVVLTLGLPAQLHTPIPLTQRQHFIRTLCDAVMELAAQQ